MSGSEIDQYWKLEDFDDIMGGFDRILEGSTKPPNSKLTQSVSHRGKRKGAAALLLGRLARTGSKPLKKEYVRTQLIRGHKKALRKLAQSNSRYQSEANTELTLTQQFLQVFRQNRDLLKRLAKPSSGPLTDAKTGRRIAKNAPKTWGMWSIKCNVVVF